MNDSEENEDLQVMLTQFLSLQDDKARKLLNVLKAHQAAEDAGESEPDDDRESAPKRRRRRQRKEERVEESDILTVGEESDGGGCTPVYEPRLKEPRFKGKHAYPPEFNASTANTYPEKFYKFSEKVQIPEKVKISEKGIPENGYAKKNSGAKTFKKAAKISGEKALERASKATSLPRKSDSSSKPGSRVQNDYFAARDALRGNTKSRLRMKSQPDKEGWIEVRRSRRPRDWEEKANGTFDPSAFLSENPYFSQESNSDDS